MFATSQLVSVYRGVLPPTNPSEGTIWISESFLDQNISDSIADRAVMLAPSSSGFESGVCQEPNVFYNTVLNNWGMIYGGLQSQGYATASNAMGPWTKFSATAVLGNGQGGQTNSAQHGKLYIEGTNLYFTFVDGTTHQFKVATSTMAAPQTWTTVGNVMAPTSQVAGNNLGNSLIIKRGTNDYLFFFEESITNAIWQIGVASGTSPTGPFTAISQITPTLWPAFTNETVTGAGGAYTASSIRPFLENGRYIGYYHGGPNGNAYTEIYRATSYDAFTWTIDNNNQPIVRRRLPQECSQVADICVVQSPSGPHYAFWDGYNNQASTTSIIGTTCLPTIKQWDSASNIWVAIQKAPGITNDEFFYNNFVYTAAHTASHRETVLCNVGGGAFTVTLPRADVGTVVRIMNVSTSGANVVTVLANGLDTALPATTIANNTWLDFRCEIAGVWGIK